MKEKNKNKPAEQQSEKQSFVQEIKHTNLGTWHQYDVLLDARGYGWETMKEWADYAIGADLENVSEVTVGTLGLETADITKSFSEHSEKCTQTPELEVEHGMLSIAGMSKALSAPMKIVWTNQTRTLRFFTLIDDENAIAQYTDILAYRTFDSQTITFSHKNTQQTKEETPNTQKTYKKLKQYAAISYILIAAIIASVASYFSFPFLLRNLETEWSLIIIVPVSIVLWVSICLFSAKFRYCLKSYRAIKKNDNEYYLDDIDFCKKGKSIICGKDVLFNKTPFAIIPYSDIVWVHPHKSDSQYIVIHTKDNAKYQFKISLFSDYMYFVKTLKQRNPEIIDKNDENFARKERPELFKREHKNKVIVAGFLLCFGIGLFIIGVMNKTLEPGNITIVLLLVLIGVFLLFYAKFANSWKESFNKFSDKLHNSPIINKAARIFFLINIVSALSMVISGLAKIETGVKIFMPLYLISVVPFFLSIFLNLGDFEKKKPIKVNGNKIYTNTPAFFQWQKGNPSGKVYVDTFAISLKKKEPEIHLYDDGKKSFTYTLQTEGNEDFTGKYFIATVAFGFLYEKKPRAIQISGFISDTPEKRDITLQDIGYRMEMHFVKGGGATSKELNEALHGQDLAQKGLKYLGYTTPSNIRLVGICPRCKKSFAFHGYAVYMAQYDVAYSDDGLDCCQISSRNIDKKRWSYETDGKIFRYYNSFNCPHCQTPYIDYQKYPENKVFGASGCVHLGKKIYTEELK